MDLNGATEFGQFLPIAGLIVLALAWSMRDTRRTAPRSRKRRSTNDNR